MDWAGEPIDIIAITWVYDGMNTQTESKESGNLGRAPRHPWYYISVGLVVAGSLVLFAILPQSFAGLSFVAAALVVAVVDFLARRADVSPFSTRLGRVALIYIGVIAVALILAVILVWVAVGGGNGFWVALAAGVVVFAVIALGAWVVERPSSKTVTL